MSRSLLVGSSALLVLLVCAVATQATSSYPGRAPKWEALTADYSFEQYAAHFGKLPYSGGATEEKMRREVFESNLKIILKHNSQGKKSSYKMGVNHLTDRTPTELQAMNGGKSTKVASNVAERLQSVEHQKKVRSGADLSPLPVTVDYRLRSPPVLSAIKGQGSCGSCFAHAATENIETYYAMATGQMWALSQEEATACTPNKRECGGTGGCDGGIAEDVFNYAKEHGLSQEWQIPYTSYRGVTGTCKNTSAPSYVWLSGYKKLAANDQGAVMRHLVEQGPLAVNVDASTWSFYEAGVFDGCTYAVNISIDHVVQLIGYGHDEALQASYWIIRNSWDPRFGENGYIRLFRSSNNTDPGCGLNVNAQDGTACAGQSTTQHVCGECGILWDTSYPEVLV